MKLADLTVLPPEKGPADWNDEGVVIFKQLMPGYLMSAYEDRWILENRERNDRPGGWPDCTPYRRHLPLLDLLSFHGLHVRLKELLGEPAGVHLNLTGWVSTERNWHQDTYLNPPHVGDYYAAVWIALADIHPDSGPFQYVPGSHRWPVVTREKILAALEPHERDHRWPKFSERLLTELFEREIVERGAEVVTYLPKLGDVLIWHGRLVHRGSKPKVQGMERRALIAHYSGIDHRQDMPEARVHNSGFYFPIDGGSHD